MTVRPVRFTTDDGCDLEGQFDLGGPEARIAVVLCHPHPQFGGSMRSIVTSVLFSELPAAGHPCLRFNFRGVEGSTGEYSDGEREPLDVVAAIGALAEALAGEGHPAGPIAIVGWSFGADISLTIVDERVAGWVAIAPPLRFKASFPAASDPRWKHLILAEHDEFRAPDEVKHETEAWTATTVAIVAGASHFFVGRTDGVVRETRAALDRVTAR